jgi:hypothetical protein
VSEGGELKLCLVFFVVDMGFVFPIEVTIGCQGTNNLGKKERNQGLGFLMDGWVEG